MISRVLHNIKFYENYHLDAQSHVRVSFETLDMTGMRPVLG